MSEVGAYVINLDRRPERLAEMARGLAAVGVPFTRVPAIDGTLVPLETLSARFPAKGPLGEVGQGDKAVTLSHFKAMEMFLATDQAAAVILEDDVEVSADFGAVFADLDWLPVGAHLVKFETYVNDGIVMLLAPATGRIGARALHPLLTKHVGGAGYLVTRAGAARVLEAARGPVPVPIDHFLFNPNASPLSRTLKPLQVHPAMIRQRRAEMPSDNTVQRAKSVPTGMAYWRRELRRGLIELNLLHRQLAALAFREARLVKPYWDGGEPPQKETP